MGVAPVTPRKPNTIILLEQLLHGLKYKPTDYCIEHAMIQLHAGDLPDTESICLFTADLALTHITSEMLDQVDKRPGPMSAKMDVHRYSVAELSFPNWPARIHLLRVNAKQWLSAGLMEQVAYDDIIWSTNSFLRGGPYNLSRQQKIINAHLAKLKQDHNRYVLLE